MEFQSYQRLFSMSEIYLKTNITGINLSGIKFKNHG